MDAANAHPTTSASIRTPGLREEGCNVVSGPVGSGGMLGGKRDATGSGGMLGGKRDATGSGGMLGGKLDATGSGGMLGGKRWMVGASSVASETIAETLMRVPE